jgi:hypothetical protein
MSLMSEASALRSSSSRSMRSMMERSRSAGDAADIGRDLAVAVGLRFRRALMVPRRLKGGGSPAGTLQPRINVNAPVNAPDWRRRTSPSARPRLPSGAAPASPCRACRRRSPAPSGSDERDALLLGGGAVPAERQFRQKPGQVHHVDVLHVGARAQVLDQAAEGGGLDLSVVRIEGRRWAISG